MCSGAVASCQHLEQRIATATSVSAFEASDIRSYRSQLRLVLCELVRCSAEFSLVTRSLTDGRTPKARSQHIFVIKHQSRTPSTTHHDNSTIEACLRGLQSNLLLLFQHHDDFISRSASASRHTESTALEEIFYAMLDPTIVPYACSGPFIRLLAKGYVEYSTSKVSLSLSIIGRQSHRDLLKHALCAFANRSPQIALARLLVSYFRTILRVETPNGGNGSDRKKNLQKTDILDSIDNYNVNRAGQCVELIEYLVTALPDARFEGSTVALLIEAIRDIDGADVLLAKSSRSTQGMKVAKRSLSSCCSRCRTVNGEIVLQNIKSLAVEPLSRNRKRSAKTASLMDLHDEARLNEEDHNSEDDCGIAIESSISNADEGPTTQRVSLTKRMRNFGNEPRVSMKRVMGSVSSSPDNMLLTDKMQCTCLCYTKPAANDGLNGIAFLPADCEIQGTSRRCSNLSLKMIQLRSNTYRALLSLTKYHMYENISCDEEITRSINEVIFNKSIQQMKAHPMCAASRLCVVLVADVRGIENGFLPLLEKLLVISAHSLGGLQTSLYIRAYAELLVNLAVFDDPSVFWKATKSLLDRAVEKSSHCHEYQMTILRAISYIFVERHRTVSAVKKSELHPYITCLSEMFGSQACWIHESMVQEEKEEIIYTLQALGVLGFVDVDGETTTPEMDNCSYASLSGESFPFLPPSSLRDAVARMGPHVGCNRFLSRLDAMNLLRNDHKKAQIVLRDRADSFDDGTPILEHLKDDFLIQRIFSFLNHRKLSAVSRVCRVWRQIANEPALWQRLYRLRFKTLVEVDAIPSSACSKLKLSCASKENDGDWRKMFDAKWLAERQLRSSFSKCGKWRHKTCDFVGCLAVLKSKASYEKHICKHKNDLAKKVERAAAYEERKRKRIAAAAAAKEEEAEERCKEKKIKKQRKKE